MSFHSQTFNTVGNPTFTVPTYGILIVLVGGPGQGGQGGAGDDGSGGGSNTFAANRRRWIAQSLIPGTPEFFALVPGSPGSPPTADTLWNTGGAQVKGTGYSRGNPTGGTYNSLRAGALGGAGGSGFGAGNPGLPGNLAVKIYFPGDLVPTTNIPIVIPAGGTGGAGGFGAGGGGGVGGTGGTGFVTVLWTDAGSYQQFIASGTFSVPNYLSLTVFEFASGGGGKGTDAGSGVSHDGGAATNSTFSATVVANGGGDSSIDPSMGSGSGGDQSYTGAGATGGALYNSGGFTYKTYAPGALTGSITVTIPNGGTGGPGTGTPGTPGVKGQTIVSYIPVATPHSQAFMIG